MNLLEDIAMLIEEEPIRVTVKGYSKFDDAESWQLSTERVQAVAQRIQSKKQAQEEYRVDRYIPLCCGDSPTATQQRFERKFERESLC